MQITIRQETEQDHPQVFDLITSAFATEPMSDQQEQFLVERLRKSDAFIPELSLVAEIDNRIIGYILLTKLKINNTDHTHDSLALAPVAVLPEYQGQGVGSRLIRKAHELATALGHKSVVLLGHADYYPRFGYRPAHTFGIQLPFDVPKENFMALELVEHGLQGVTGIVEYPKAFFG